jgi:hypothetical protein
VSPNGPPPRAGRWGAAALFATGLLVLLFDAYPEVPLVDSVRLGRTFWRASPHARVLNAPSLRENPEFAAVVASVDARWPLDVDVVLVLPKDLPGGAAETLRRAAALHLSPRRVLLERAALSSAEGFELRPRARSRP